MAADGRSSQSRYSPAGADELDTVPAVLAAHGFLARASGAGADSGPRGEESAWQAVSLLAAAAEVAAML
eukprot:5340637-Pleurochrysis_carterae.AAC.1